MSLEASGLKVVVESHGINSTTDALNKLAIAGDKADRSTTKLSQSNKNAQAAADKSAKTWYDLVDKVSKAKEREYNILQRHNNKVYAMAQAEANKMNSAMDRIVAQDNAKFAARRAQEQKQLEQLDIMRRNAANKEYARVQAEANKINTLLDRQRKQQEAAAKASAERQRVQNSAYSSSSLAQQIATLQRAQAYGAQGGNVTNRYGSNVSGALSSGELQRLTQQYQRLQLEARRANGTMADTHAAVRGLSGSLGALWLTYGNLLPLMAGAGIGMAIKGIVDVGSDIEHTLEKIRVLGQATTSDIEAMRTAIYDLGQGVQGPRDVAQALSVLTLAGLKAGEAMQGVGASLNLAVAGDVSIEKSASTLVQVRTSLGYTAKDFDHIADVIAKTAAVSMSSVDSISGAFLSAAAVGEVYGASLKDIGLGLATVANLGIQATAAGTTLKNFYADLAKGSEKSTSTLKAMGLTLNDLKDANGGFIDLVDLVAKLEKGFSKLNPKARAEAMDKLFGERGIKTGAALIRQINTMSTEMDEFGEVYKNKLLEVAGEIERSAAFATTAALAMSQTSTNQMKSVGNTLQTVLGQAFASIAPQIGQVARALKAAFTSPEFMNGLKFIATSIANLTLFVVEHGKQIAIMVAAYAGWKIGLFAAGLITMARSFDVAKIAARGFTAALGPLGLAITALGVAWELYASQKNKAITDNDANAGSLDEYAKGLKEAAVKEAEALKMRKDGVSELEVARREQLNNDKAASAKLVQASADGVNAMKKSLDEQYAALSENEKKRVAMIRGGQTEFGSRETVNYVQSLDKYMTAYNKHLDTVKDIAASEKSLFKDRKENGRLADEAAKKGWIKPTGDGELTGGDAEKAAKKATTFIKTESLELAKLTAGYEAKNAAMLKTIASGKLVMAETQQAIVMENLAAGKYGTNKAETNPLYQAQLRLALAADESKARNESLKKVTEFANKLVEVEAAQVEYNKLAIDGSNMHYGALRKEAEGVIQLNSLVGETADNLRKRADAADAFRKQQEAIVKLNSAIDSSRGRAEEAKEEVELMLQYGENTKLGAIAVAELLIKKLQLNDASSAATKNALMEAAATEQLNTAYRDLLKQQIDINKAAGDAQAESKLIFASSEADKVKIANETRKKLLTIEYQKVQDAYKAKEESGKVKPEDFDVYKNAYNAYVESTNKSDQVAAMETNNLKLKDWKKTIDDIEQIGREGFYNLSEKGTSLWKSMTSTFKSMFKTTVMDYIYKEFAKPIMMKVIASLAGVVGADGLSQAANAMGGNSTGGGIGSWISNGKKLYDMYQTGFSGIGKSVASSIGQYAGPAIEGLGSLFGNSAMSSFGAGLGANVAGSGNAAMYASAQTSGNLSAGAVAGKGAGTAIGGAASIAAGVAGGVYGGRAISGGFSAFGGSGNSAVNTGTAIGAAVGSIIPVIGTAFGALVGGLLGGAVNRLFGHKAKEVTDQGIRGTLSSTDATGQAYTDWKQKGGWFRSDKKGTDVSALASDMQNSLVGGFNTLKSAATDVAKNLGVSSDALIGYSKAFDIKLTSDAAKNEEALAKFFTDMGDEMALKLVPNVMEFAKQGEGAAVALERLSNVFEVTKQLSDILGKSVAQVFGSDGMSSAKARTMLIDLSGGVDALASRTSAYMNAIYTDSEKLAPAQKALNEAMSALGFGGIKTKAQFKNLVESLKLTDEASIKTFNSLLDLAPAFGQITEASDAVAKEAASNMTSAIDRLKEFGNSIRDFRNGLVLGNLSTLTPEQKLQAAANQYQATLQKALSGDEKAQSNLTDIAQSYLEAGRTLYASSEAYSKIFDKVQQDLAMTEVWAGQEASFLQQQVDALTNMDKTLEQILAVIEDRSNTSIRGDFQSSASPITYMPAGGNSVDVAEAMEVLAKAIAEGNESIVGEIRKMTAGTYDSNIKNADMTVAGVSAAIKSGNSNGQYAIKDR